MILNILTPKRPSTAFDDPRTVDILFLEIWPIDTLPHEGFEIDSVLTEFEGEDHKLSFFALFLEIRDLIAVRFDVSLRDCLNCVASSINCRCVICQSLLAF
jgi:hypothetical protein